MFCPCSENWIECRVWALLADCPTYYSSSPGFPPPGNAASVAFLSPLFTMASNKSSYDGPLNEKGINVVGPSLPERTASRDDGIQHGSRKGSLVASLKQGYGLAEVGTDEESIRQGVDMTHRKLKARHIQLIGIGGTIGTALFVQIGRGLINGGPASLFMAFTIWYVFPPKSQAEPQAS